MIVASEQLIEAWRAEAGRAVRASNRPLDPTFAAPLAAAPREVVELVSLLSSSLSRAAGILLGSAANAIPGATKALEEGIANLTREIHAQQVADRAAEQAGDGGYVCPLPQIDGSPFRCGCPVADRCGEALAYTAGVNPGLVSAPGVEPHTDRVDADLEQVVEDDRATRGDDGCEGGTR